MANRSRSRTARAAGQRDDQRCVGFQFAAFARCWVGFARLHRATSTAKGGETGYSAADYALLIEVIDGADRLIATPNALTEVSNLLDYGVNEPLRSELWEGLRAVIDKIGERYQPSMTAAAEPEFVRLGLADSAWLGCLGPQTVFLTADVELFNAASSRGLVAYNFTHLREQRALL